MRYFPFIIISLIIYSLFFYHSQKPQSLSVDIHAQQEKIIKNKIIPFEFEKLPESTSISEPTVDNDLINQTLTVTAPVIAKGEETENKTLKEVTQETLITNTQKITPASDLFASDTPEKLSKAIKTKSENIKVVPEYSMPEPISASPVTAAETTKSKVVNEPQNKLEKKPLLPLHSIQASESALLKGEFYDNNFHLYLSAPPIKSNKASTKIVQNPTTKSNTSTAQKSASESLLKITQNVPNSLKNKNTSTTDSEKPKRNFKKVLKPLINKTGGEIPEAIVASGKQPLYPKQALNEKLQGTVTVKFLVSMQGKSKNPKMVSSSGHKILDTTVLDFVKKERFMPSFDGIEKVTREQQFSFKFIAE